MAQFYTPEEAAHVLGMSLEELQAKVQNRQIHAFLDGGTWRFRVVDVDELARRRGLGRDAGLPSSDSDLAIAPAGDGTLLDDLELSEYQLGVAQGDPGPKTSDISSVATPAGAAPTRESGSAHDILFDDLSVPPNPMAGSSSVIIGMQPTGKDPSDSDVRLVPINLRSASDSDVGLATPDPDLELASESDVTLIEEDTADHRFLAASSGSGDTVVRPSPISGSSPEVPARGSESDFELSSPSELVEVLQPESEVDFELSALVSSDEIQAPPRRSSDSDVTAAAPNVSGINLSRPSDSGIELHGLGASDLGQESIELAPLSDDQVPILKSEPPKPVMPAQAEPAKPRPSLAATPQPAVSKGEKDIFDDTDFEFEVAVPHLDEETDDQTVQLEAASEFDLEDGESGSEVFAFDEAEVDQNAATAMAPAAFVEEEEDEDDGFEEAVSSEMASAWSSSGERAFGAAGSGPAIVISRDVTPEWGGMWVGLLGLSSLAILFMLFIAIDLMHNLYDFHETWLASSLVRSIASLFPG
jgi:excisionase family DNA binding protein